MDLQSTLYLYFDAQEYALKSRITDIINRILRSRLPVSYSDLCELLRLTAKLELLQKVELDLNSLLFYN